MKFIHTSDWHLGMTRRFLAPEEQGRFTGDRLAAVRAIAKIAEDEGCDFVVVCGDVFESNQVDRKVVSNAVEALKAFTVPVLLLPGNHDAYDATSVYRSEEFERRPDGVILLSEPGAHAVPGTAASVVAAPLKTRTPDIDLAAAALDDLSRERGVDIQILAAHGVTSDLNPDQSAVGVLEVEALEGAIAAGIVDYVALGDRHSETTVSGDKRIRYSGSPVATDFVDSETNKILIVEESGGAIETEERMIGNWSFLTNHFELSGDEDIDQIETWLDSIAEKHNCVVKFSVVGSVSLEARARLDDILDRYAELFAALWLRERKSALTVEPSAEDLERLSLAGYAAGTVEELAEIVTSGTPETSDVASDALALLYRLAASA